MFLTADMLLSELRVSVYTQLAACLQQRCHGDGNNPGEPLWVVMAETCTDLDITRQEQMDIGNGHIFFIFYRYKLVLHITNYLLSFIVLFQILA